MIARVIFFFVSATGYIDVDCGLRTSDIPSVIGVLQSGSCCSVQCEVDGNCSLPADRCAEVVLQTVNATHNATCRFLVNTVRFATLLFGEMSRMNISNNAHNLTLPGANQQKSTLDFSIPSTTVGRQEASFPFTPRFSDGSAPVEEISQKLYNYNKYSKSSRLNK